MCFVFSEMKTLTNSAPGTEIWWHFTGRTEIQTTRKVGILAQLLELRPWASQAGSQTRQQWAGGAGEVLGSPLLNAHRQSGVWDTLLGTLWGIQSLEKL